MFSFKLRTKLITHFILTGLVPFLVIGIYAFFNAGEWLEKSAYSKLTAIREIKQAQVLEHFKRIEILLNDVQVNLRFTKGLPDFEQAMAAGVTSAAYQRVLANRYAGLDGFAKHFGFDDIYLVTAKGDVVFALSKNAALGENLLQGSFKDTGLGRVFKSGQERISVQDIEIFKASGLPAAFVSTPLFGDRGESIGVAVFQINLASINQMMLRLEGMGDTGETYLIGQDGLLRSDSRLSPDRYSVKNSFLNPSTSKITSEAARLSLQTEKGVLVSKDYRGVETLASYAPVHFLSLDWGLVAKVDADEAFLGRAALRKTLWILGLFFTLAVVVLGWLLAQSIVNPLQEMINVISTSSAEIASTIEEQERIASQQSASVNETTTTMDELRSSSLQSSEQAVQASNTSQATLDMADEGNRVSQEALMGMSQLQEKIETIAGQILNLSQKIAQIGNITDIVTDLANQTRMLALNAAVEAVRAGDQGMGFSVLSTEIRKLADESKKSAERISLLVADIQNATNSLVMSTEEGTKQLEKEIHFTQTTTSSFGKVAHSTSSTFEAVQQISLNIQQQAAAVREVVVAMNNINTGIKETADGIGQTREGIRQMNQVAQKLKSII